MLKTTIIKLREQESIRSDIHGSYTTNLSRSLVMNEGDQVQIKSCFLDTTIEESIKVEEEFTATITTARYLTNYYKSDDQSYENPFRPGGTTAALTPATANVMYTAIDSGVTPNTQGPDGLKYWNCQTNPANIDNKLLLSINLKWIHRRGDFGAPVQFQLMYKNPVAPHQFIPSKMYVLPKLKGRKFPENNAKYILQPQLWVNTTGLADPSLAVKLVPVVGHLATWEDGNMYTPGSTANPDPFNFDPGAQSQKFLSLVEDECNIDIPAGEYTPSHIAQIITDEMSQLVRTDGKVGDNYTNGEYLVDSPFLASIAQTYFKVLNNLAKPPILDVQNADSKTMMFMSETIKDRPGGVFSQWGRPISAAEDNLIGTNNAAMNYDTTLNKLSFDVLHFPVQVNSANVNVPGIRYPPKVATFSSEPVLSYSGVGIVNLNPPDFWANLGFDSTNLITANPQIGVLPYTPGYFYASSPPASPPVLTALNPGSIHLLGITSTAGVNTTEQYAGMDLVVTSEGVTPPTVAKWMQPDLNTLGVASAITTPIMGNRQFSGSSVNDGFYMINIGVNMPQKMISSNQFGVVGSNELQSIVGKFYTQGNFLQDDGSGSIVYTHTGPPTLLSSLNIKIVNGDGSQPTNTDLGDNTTIFLELTSQAPQPTAVEPPQNSPLKLGEKK